MRNIGQIDTLGFWAVQRYNPSTGALIDPYPVPIYIPATPCKIDHSNVVGSESGRDERGIMHIDWVRPDVRKVYLQYGALTGREVKYLKDLMQGRQFYFTFLQDDEVVTINAYGSESSYESYSYSHYMGDKVYINFKLNVIEL